MKLSIVTIIYNNKKGLAKTIESVVNQEFKDFDDLLCILMNFGGF